MSKTQTLEPNKSITLKLQSKFNLKSNTCLHHKFRHVMFLFLLKTRILLAQSFGNPNCSRCFGTGFDAKKRKPCKICTAASGVCYKCGGSGITRKGKPCKNCAYHSNAGICPACTLKKAISGKNSNRFYGSNF